jgi:SAM-dependent methyltransferase
MFDAIAGRYDLLNDILSGGQVRLWRRVVARIAGARPGERVLDLAAGTGTSTLTFTATGADAVACDFSLGMLRAGRARPSRGPRGDLGWARGSKQSPSGSAILRLGPQRGAERTGGFRGVVPPGQHGPPGGRYYGGNRSGARSARGGFRGVIPRASTAYFMMSRMRPAVSLGVLPTRTPAFSRASFLAWAVPDEPEMIAPA